MNRLAARTGTNFRSYLCAHQQAWGALSALQEQRTAVLCFDFVHFCSFNSEKAKQQRVKLYLHCALRCKRIQSLYGLGFLHAHSNLAFAYKLEKERNRRLLAKAKLERTTTNQQTTTKLNCCSSLLIVLSPPFLYQTISLSNILHSLIISCIITSTLIKWAFKRTPIEIETTIITNQHPSKFCHKREGKRKANWTEQLQWLHHHLNTKSYNLYIYITAFSLLLHHNIATLWSESLRVQHS